VHEETRVSTPGDGPSERRSDASGHADVVASPGQRGRDEERLPLSTAPFGAEVEGQDPHRARIADVSPPLSVVLLVKNESDRLGDALESVSWAEDVVVADTGSTDGTVDVARRFGARVHEIPWEGFVASRNRALGEAKNDWVLALDADERLTQELKGEVLEILEARGETLAGVEMPRLSYFLGRPIRHGTWYPDVKLRLGRRSRGFRAEGGRVHEAFAVDGEVARLSRPLIHHPYRDLSDALRKASTYARLGADDRYDKGARGSLTRLLLRPAFEFFRSYVWKAGFLDGAIGPSIAFFHAWSYFLRGAFLYERERLEKESARNADVGGSPMKFGPKVIAGAIALSLTAGFGCSNEKPGPFEKAGKKADEKADELKKEVDAAAEKTKKDLEEARKKAAETGEAIAEKAKDATEKAAEKVSEKTKQAGEAVKETARDVKEDVAKGIDKARATPTPGPRKN